MSVAKWILAFQVILQHRLCLLDNPLAESFWLQNTNMTPPTENPLQYFALLVWFERDEQSIVGYLLGGNVI
jgi:hypothetical protein